MGHFGMLKGDQRGGRVRQYGDISILWEGRILELVQLAPGSRYGRRDYLELLRPVKERGGNEYERRYFRGGFPLLSERISAIVTRLAGNGKA